MSHKRFWAIMAIWFAVLVFIFLCQATDDNGKAESYCTTWLQTDQGSYGQCGNWGVWQNDNQFPWPSSPWLPGRTGIPGSPGYNPGTPFGPPNGPPK